MSALRLSSAFLVLIACDPAEPTKGTTSPTPSGMASGKHTPGMEHPAAAGAPDNAHTDHAAQGFDQMFIDMMVHHHQGAIDMAKIADRRAEHAEIKAMASSITIAQEAEIEKMKAWRKDWFGSADVPKEMPMGHADMPGMASMMQMDKDIDVLKAATPFDLAFIDAMIPHHEGAIAMAKEAATKAQHSEIKALSESIIGDQQREIDQMKAWRTAWFPTAPAVATGPG